MKAFTLSLLHCKAAFAPELYISRQGGGRWQGTRGTISDQGYTWRVSGFFHSVHNTVSEDDGALVVLSPISSCDGHLTVTLRNKLGTSGQTVWQVWHTCSNTLSLCSGCKRVTLRVTPDLKLLLINVQLPALIPGTPVFVGQQKRQLCLFTFSYHTRA